METGGPDCLSCRIDDVEEWDRQPRREGVGDPVHGVRHAKQELSARALEPLRLGCEVARAVVPEVAADEALDLGEIDRADDDLGGVPAAQPGIHRLIDEPVVFGRGLVAHAAEHANSRHPRHVLRYCATVLWCGHCGLLSCGRAT